MDGAVDNAVLIILVCILLVGGYFTWDTYRVFEAGNCAQYTQYKPPAEEDNVDPTFDELVAINSDVFGWITVFDTGIDFPLLQGESNATYLNKNAKGELSMAGSIFLDSDNSKDFTDFNSIVYGHHMVQSAMFGDIEKFSEKKYFKEHKYGNIFYGNKDHGIVFFAYIDTLTGYDSIYKPGIKDKSEREKYLEYIYEKAKYTRDIDVSSDEQIVLLSTCSVAQTDGRDILVGKITEETYKSLDKTTGEDSDSIWDKILRWLSWVPIWIWPVLVAFIVGLILWIRKKRKNIERGCSDEQENV